MVAFIRNGLAIGLLPRSHVETSEIAFVPIREHPQIPDDDRDPGQPAPQRGAPIRCPDSLLTVSAF
jgi:hypothetical protein